MNGFFNSNLVVLIIFAFCCNGIAFILGIVGLVTCTDPVARRNALIVTIIGALTGGAGLVYQLASGVFH